MKEHSTEVDALYNTIKELESKICQEQYSRRTSLRFHNIKVSVDERGNVKHPVNTNELILNVCNNKRGLDINLHDIGRSHIIGKVKDVKSQVIVRFISYRTRTKVHSNKKGLEKPPRKHFHHCNPYQYRTELVKQLAELKYNGLLYTSTTSQHLFILNKLLTLIYFVHCTQYFFSRFTRLSLLLFVMLFISNSVNICFFYFLSISMHNAR